MFKHNIPDDKKKEEIVIEEQKLGILPDPPDPDIHNFSQDDQNQNNDEKD